VLHSCSRQTMQHPSCARVGEGAAPQRCPCGLVAAQEGRDHMPASNARRIRTCMHARADLHRTQHSMSRSLLPWLLSQSNLAKPHQKWQPLQMPAPPHADHALLAPRVLPKSARMRLAPPPLRSLLFPAIPSSLKPTVISPACLSRNRMPISTASNCMAELRPHGVQFHRASRQQSDG